MVERRFIQRITGGVLALLVCSFSLFAQDEKELKPVTRTYAITNVNVVPTPGKKIDMATILIKDGLITAVGKGIAIPADAIVIKADSMYVYAGFIDGLSRVGVTKPKEEISRERVKDPGNPAPERAGITPQNDVRGSLNASDKSIEDLRNIGFTVAQVVPYGNLLPGQGSIVLLSGKSADQMVLVSNSSLYSELSGANGVYPNTTMAVIAKWRELYRQASQAKSYQSLYASNRVGLERPGSDRVLEAFYPVIDQRIPVLFKSEKMLDAHRILTLKSDLGFSLVMADVKEGWPVLSKIKVSGAKVFLSLDLPEEAKKDDKKSGGKSDKKADSTKAKEVAKPKTAADLERDALEKRKSEAIANYTTQASVFNKAGVSFGFSSLSAKPKDIPANLRRMIAAGLSEDAALAALTTTPAQLLGLSDRMGTVENGKMANLVISDKSYFNEKAKVRYVFVDGVMYKLEVKEENLHAGQAGKADPNAKVEIEGSWSTVTQTPQGSNDGKVTFKKDGSGYKGTISGGRMPAPADLTSVTLEGNKLSYSYSLSFGGNSIKVDVEATVEGDSFKGNASIGLRGSFSIEGTKNPKN
ncbi:MAG: amidohydrolase family protein [Cytophagales bacterium]|nr:amidohydrolase family protein [Cytophagales bacterium]MCA6369217.1 amidohydrolase family protein [Cytophagales bacterium]MCA6372380.1 amidohydrolase family protein [Cytophagales bacterium]MCA6374781.1 amidohydrolase family protein [Cytophagales bacterium]MCA6382229.1 amidohydrolase family protein [Cytophagales bacterium]